MISKIAVGNSKYLRILLCIWDLEDEWTFEPMKAPEGVDPLIWDSEVLDRISLWDHVNL